MNDKTDDCVVFFSQIYCKKALHTNICGIHEDVLICVHTRVKINFIFQVLWNSFRAEMVAKKTEEDFRRR